MAGVYESGFVGKMIFRDLFYKEATLQGSNSYGVWNGENEFDIALRMVEEEEINTSDILTHILPLKEFSKGVKLMNEKEKSGAIKVVYRC